MPSQARGLSIGAAQSTFNNAHSFSLEATFSVMRRIRLGFQLTGSQDWMEKVKRSITTLVLVFFGFNNFIETYCPKGVGHEQDSRSHDRCPPASVNRPQHWH